MAFKVTTAVATEPLTATEAKLHLKVDTSDDDTIVTALITAAREFSEHYTGKAFAPVTLEMALDCFPYDADDGDADEGIDLDMPPVASITHVKYTDIDGVEQTITSTNYALSTYGTAARITPVYGYSWPSTQDIENAVRVRYVAGYTTLPKAARAALLLLIGHLYENRQSVSALTLAEIPMGARALLDTVKDWSK